MFIISGLEYVKYLLKTTRAILQENTSSAFWAPPCLDITKILPPLASGSFLLWKETAQTLFQQAIASGSYITTWQLSLKKNFALRI